MLTRDLSKTAQKIPPIKLTYKEMLHLSFILPPDFFLSLSNGGNLNKKTETQLEPTLQHY